jgi:hypothetical protein
VNDLDDIAAQIDQLDELVRVEMGSQKKHAALVNGGSSEADATNAHEALSTGTTGGLHLNFRNPNDCHVNLLRG